VDEGLSMNLPGRLTRVSVLSEEPAPEPAGGNAPAGGPQAPDVQREAQRLLEKERGDLKLARQSIQSALERLGALEAQWARQAEEQVVDLALAVAAKVLMQEIRAERHEIDPIVKALLGRLPAGQDAVLRMHPQDLLRCELARAADSAGDGAPAGVRFVADSTVKRAECILETPQGFVRTDVESHLRELAAALRTPE
jgi:flagellar assembly protein FliH